MAIALVNVMARDLIFHPSNHGLSYINFGALSVVIVRLFLLYGINFVEPEVHKLSILVAKFAKLS